MSLLSHDRYQYDGLILSQTDLSISSSTLATAVVMRCFSSFKLTGSAGRKLCLWYTHTRRNHKELSLDLLHNVSFIVTLYNPTSPLSYIRPVVNRNVLTQRMTVLLRAGSFSIIGVAGSKTCAVSTFNKYYPVPTSATAARHFVLPHSCLAFKMAALKNITPTGRQRHEACPDTYSSHCRRFELRMRTAMFTFIASAPVEPLVLHSETCLYSLIPYIQGCW